MTTVEGGNIFLVGSVSIKTDKIDRLSVCLSDCASICIFISCFNAQKFPNYGFLLSINLTLIVATGLLIRDFENDSGYGHRTTVPPVTESVVGPCGV